MADSLSGRPGADLPPNLANCDSRPNDASSRPTLRPGEAIWRVALGAEEPLQGRLAALIDTQRDMTCALATSHSHVLTTRFQRACPDVLVVDMAWGDGALSVIAETMRMCPLPIVVVDTELWSPFVRERLERAWRLGIVGVIPYPKARGLRSTGTRSAPLDVIRSALRAPLDHTTRTSVRGARSESPAW